MAQKLIITSLSRQFPRITIIGEEGSNEEQSGDVIINEYDEFALQKECPRELLDVVESQVSNLYSLKKLSTWYCRFRIDKSKLTINDKITFLCTCCCRLQFGSIL